MKPGWKAFALVGVLYYAAAKLGMLTVMPEGMSVFWPPNGVVLAALLYFRGARLPVFGAVVIAAEVAADVPAFSVTEALLFGIINFAESAGAFLLLRRLRFDPAFPTLADMWRFLLAGPLLAAGAASLLGAAVYSVFRGGETSYLQFAHTWWAGDALGLLVVTPLLLGFPPFRTMREDPVPFMRLDAAVAAIAVLAGAAIWNGSAPVVLLVPVVLYFGVRHAPRWAAAVVCTCVAFVVVALASGVPFGPVAGKEAVVYVQRFLFVLSILGLGFSALISQLREERAVLERRVAERTDELQRANEELARLAVIDSLTGIGNRRSFDESLVRETERARRYRRPLALVFADLDHFKRVNDTHGHAAGDEVIRAFARLLGVHARRSDLVARHGGEEFAVLMPETTSASALGYAERVRSELAGLGLAPVEGPVTASFGVVELLPGESDAEFMARADGALYDAKRGGRNRVAMRGLPEESRDSAPAAVPR